ncbi:MAG: TonB family protein [Candidatus Eremiobacteraeota bacterium]|nr:TonB family protein [Candidatus Eremiobacteraeota bacterium]
MRHLFTVTIVAFALLIQASGAAGAAQLVAVESKCDAPAAVYGSTYADMPPIGDELGASGTAVVKIDLSASGMLAHEELYSSSGNWWLDDAAMRSVRLTRFTPEIRGCRRVAASYLYEVDFQ